MNAWIEIAGILIIAAGWFLLILRSRPRRDICQPLTNEDRLLRYIERRAAWECEQRKRKLLQRQRVERMLERRWLDRDDPRGHRRAGPTVPRPLMSEAA